MKQLLVLALIAMVTTPQTTNMETVNAGVSRVIAEDVRQAVNNAANEEVKEEENKINQDDVDLLARLIYAETNTLSYEAQSYAGSVALNRVKHKNYPDTLYEVVYQKGQYACVNDGHLENANPTDEQYKLAEDLLTNGSVLPDSVIYQSEFTQGSGIYTQIGNTYFCYE